MLSVCIPVYNYDVNLLVRELHAQLSGEGIPFEILLMDDASRQEFREKNSRAELESVKYIQLPENTGRSSIRNRLAEESAYPYLIFMDCDSAVPSAGYIKKYIACCQPMVVCYGGRIYNPEPPEDDTFLRWKYGVERESFPAGVRSRNPNYSFCTNNFLIDKQVFQDVRFDEELEGYGHEDTLFGVELLNKGITIKHIENPLVHLGLEKADEFLKKTLSGVANLRTVDEILKKKGMPFPFEYSRLMSSRNKLEKYGLLKPAAFLFSLTRGSMEKNLLGKKPSLRVMDLYKLGFLSELTSGKG